MFSFVLIINCFYRFTLSILMLYSKPDFTHQKKSSLPLGEVINKFSVSSQTNSFVGDDFETLWQENILINSL